MFGFFTIKRIKPFSYFVTLSKFKFLWAETSNVLTTVGMNLDIQYYLSEIYVLVLQQTVQSVKLATGQLGLSSKHLSRVTELTPGYGTSESGM